MFASLAKTYASLVIAIEAWSEERLTFRSVVQKLTEEWEKRQTRASGNQQQATSAPRALKAMELDSDDDSDDETALKVQQEKRGKSASNDWSDSDWNGEAATERRRCHLCHKPGHLRANCPMKKKKFFEMRDNVKMLTENDWIVDSGATSHMCKEKNLFSDLKRTSQNKIFLGDGRTITSEGIGKVNLILKTNKSQTVMEISDVLFVPDLAENIISVKKLSEKNIAVEFIRDKCFVREAEGKYEIASIRGGLYKLHACRKETCATSKEFEETEFCVHQWHKRLAHRNLKDIKNLEKDGIKVKACDCSDICESCIKGKMARKSFPKRATPTDNCLDVVVSDICGPMQVESLGRKRYFATFIDIHTSY